MDSKILQYYQNHHQQKNQAGDAFVETPPSSLASICLDLIQSSDPCVLKLLTNRHALLTKEGQVRHMY